MDNINVPESTLLQLDGLNSVYTEAASRKDYRTCDLIRIEFQRVLTGQKLLIPIGDSLNLSSYATK